jgi:hypothetical protein
MVIHLHGLQYIYKRSDSYKICARLLAFLFLIWGWMYPWCDVCIWHSLLLPFSEKVLTAGGIREREKTLFQCKYLHMRKSGLQQEEKRLEHWPGQNSSQLTAGGGTRTRFPIPALLVGTIHCVQGHICILRYNNITYQNSAQVISLGFLRISCGPPPPYLPRIFIIIWHIFREKRGRP